MVTIIIIAGFALVTGFLAGRLLFPQLKEDQNRIIELERSRAAIDAEKRALTDRLHAQEEDLLRVREQMRTEFENAAGKLFSSSSNQLQESAEKTLQSMLTPFKERLQELQKTVADTYSNESRERFALKKEIERIVEESQRMTAEAGNLTRALRGDQKSQGTWGEIALERILERSGLRKGEEYIIQGDGMGLKDPDGRIQRPDVVVVVPGAKHLIVDSKVSLTSYERFISANDESEKAEHLKDFVGSVYSHIDGLSGKEYQQNEKLVSPDFVMLFMPIEGAFALAVQTDPEIFSYAWEKRIAIVCPSTLLATLRTVASLWRFEHQNKNAMEIAKQAGALYDRFVALTNDLLGIGDQLDKTHKTYSNAMDKLKSGRGNLISRVEKLKELGAKTAKQMSAALLPDGGQPQDEEEAS
ncbi:MAG TPA: DNA recombination protein RmuC [Bdellovibrionota bacterium]|nr:DNA recombination protein RmuC [Bdellovibrionota bacterium]